MSRSQARQVAFDGNAMYVARKRAGYTQEMLARLVDVTLRTIQRWESGDGQPNGSKVLLLASTLQVMPRDLYVVTEGPVAA